MTVLFDTIFPISGYHVTELIYLGSKTLVYRAISKQEQKPVVIKLMRNEYPTFQEIAQFRNQYIITKNLDVQGIVKPLSLEKYSNSYALVMEDFGGLSLKDWKQSHKDTDEYDIDFQKFFHIAIAIASALEGLHRHRIIHKDIKPANILINPSTLETRIIDFSIATLLPREVQVLTNCNILEGTLAYLSPEQTGRMNRGIDYRSDFYSLGVTFFELLTGQLPFMSIDPMELVYCHMAKLPPTARSINPKIPNILSNMISKLMAKNAEDRYQSAYGLRYDLEFCYEQWQTTGNVPSFELATKDFSDRFLIPEKLYGRQKEVATLLAAFERVTRGTTEMILVTGFSGIGKTAVVNEVHKPIVRQRSYFIKGKFDQFQRDIPLSGIVQAFRDLIGQVLLETDTQIQTWRSKILSALGEQAQVIIEVIPELTEIIGQQPDVPKISGSAAQNRFNLLFQKFIQIFSSKNHPLVIFLDDLQWADTASLKFIQLLMNQTTTLSQKSAKPAPEIKENIWIPVFDDESWTADESQINYGDGYSLFLIGAYRDNEVSQAHPLHLTLKEIEKTQGSITQILLTPLNQSHLNTLIADTFHCQEEMTISLSQMVFAKTKGNPFFATQFLKSLYQDSLIKFNFDVGYWQYEIEEIQVLSLTEDVVEFMGLQIEKLPIMTQNVLKIAACIGNLFDLKTLAIAHEKSVIDTASDLWHALQEGIVLPQTDIYKLFQEHNSSVEVFSNQESQDSSLSTLPTPTYKFIHDRVQQAAYSLIPENFKKQIHLKIGLLLLDNIPVTEREDKIFQLVNQLNIAVELITNQSQRDELAQMNLIAGRKALVSTAYTAAIKYLLMGIEILTNDSWENQYDLTLSLHEIAAEAAYLAGDFMQMEQLIQVVLLKAKSLLERVKVYEVKIQAYTSQNKLLEAILIAKEALKQFGLNFPDNPTELDIQKRLEQTVEIVASRSIDDLANLPLITSAKELAIMRIAASMIPSTFIAAPLLFPLLICSQVELTARSGNAPLSAFFYVNYGMLLNVIKKDIDASYLFGNLSLSLKSKFNSKDITTRTLYVLGAFIFHGKIHIKDTLPILLESYQTGLETGNLEFVGYCAKDICNNLFLIGEELTTLEQTVRDYAYALKNLNQVTTLHYCQIFLQTILNFLQKNDNPLLLKGEVYDEEESLTLLIAANDINGIHYFYFYKLILNLYFCDFEQARKNANKVKEYLAGGTGFITVPIFYFYDSLTALAIYEQAESEQNFILNQVADNQIKLQKLADSAPMNYLHKFYLVEAERYRVLNRYLEAMDCYDLAISLANEHEFVHEEALAYELAARFYLQRGKHKIAQTYLTDAYYGYSRWGAKAKVDDLAKCYPQLLTPIIQQHKLKLQATETITSSTYTSIINHSNHQTAVGSKSSISDSLDLACVIKGSQALSGSIELEQLLSKLMQLVMENAGASKSALILREGETSKFQVVTVSLNSTSIPISTSFPSSALELTSHVPFTLINFVKRTEEIFVIDDAQVVTFLASDPYIIREQPKSLLCIPLINQGKVLGILYLENQLVTGAFTQERVEVIKLLSTQAAISIENAILYQNLAKAHEELEDYNHKLEEKVEARTQELHNKNKLLQEALQQLQRTQSQLIQNEKMSSLGQMVAGLAHEINNPINFIHANISYVSKYVEDLLDLIAVYQMEYPHPSNKIQKKATEIEINFLKEDLIKILNSMEIGSSRIANIVIGLRNFSRLDESEMKPVDIHEGIDNTLMILQHRLKQKNEFSEITIIKEYAKLPLVDCYAGQLNQVFMNILSNAIDALEESIVSEDIERISSKTKKPTILICTELVTSNVVRIRIADNGIGIPETVQQKIFDPFFTTKPVGSGTGLGLSISYQIIVEKHKGHLNCNTVPGQGSEFIIDIPV